MGEDWKPGDLALCVDMGDWQATFEVKPAQPLGMCPIVGLTYTVRSVAIGSDVFGRRGVALQFFEIRNHHPEAIGYNAIFFRKVEHRQADAEDAETIRLLTGEPVTVSA